MVTIVIFFLALLAIISISVAMWLLVDHYVPEELTVVAKMVVGLLCVGTMVSYVAWAVSA
jgi:hypothetical protein